MLEKNKIHKKKFFLVLIIFLIIVTPLFLNFSSRSINPIELTQELGFYEINTCGISIGSFLLKNPKVLFQDHYFIKLNSYSSGECFGTITGIDQIGYNFYISVGANSFFMLVFQSLIFFIMTLFININNNLKSEKLKFYYAAFLSSLLFTLSFVGESRFYEKSLYWFNFKNIENYIYLFLILFSISLTIFYTFFTRSDSIIYFLPWMYLITGTFTGFNFNYFLFSFVSMGIFGFISNYKIYLKSILIYISLIFIWVFNETSEDFFLKPDKIRGFINSSSNSVSIVFWSFAFYFLIIGLITIILSNKNFSLTKLYKNALNSGFLLILIGILGANFPIVNVGSFAIFGQNKITTTAKQIFQTNEWGELIAWRGFAPSAEMIGEFFAVVLFLFFLINFKNIKTSYFEFIKLVVVFIGLLASNNRAAIASLAIVIGIKIFSETSSTKIKYISLATPLILLISVIGVSNFLYDINFLSNKMIDIATMYSYSDDISSSLYYLSNNPDFFSKYLIYFLSIISFILNRSTLWGIFLSRYNPNFLSLIFGNSPYGLAKLYGEVNVRDTGSFLLPHSSLIDYFYFFGIFGILGLIYIFYKLKLINSKKLFSDSNLIILFISLNLIKSDSLLYFSSFSFYFIFFFRNAFHTLNNKFKINS